MFIFCLRALGGRAGAQSERQEDKTNLGRVENTRSKPFLKLHRSYELS